MDVLNYCCSTKSVELKINKILDDLNIDKIKELLEIFELYGHKETHQLSIKLLGNYVEKYKCISVKSGYLSVSNKNAFILLLILTNKNDVYLIGFDNSDPYGFEYYAKNYVNLNNFDIITLNESILSIFNIILTNMSTSHLFNGFTNIVELLSNKCKI